VTKNADDVAASRFSVARQGEWPMTVGSPSKKSTSNPVDQMRAMLAGHIVTQCLHSLASLGIADLIAKGHCTISDLAAKTHNVFDHPENPARVCYSWIML
jgi:hypothetical protein